MIRLDYRNAHKVFQRKWLPEPFMVYLITNNFYTINVTLPYITHRNFTV